jgi:Uma2 family endonuclease
VQIDLEPPYLVIKPGRSEEEFYRLAGEDSDWEYLDGRIVMHSPASNRHEDIFCFLLTLLRGYLDERGGALVRGSRYPMRLDARWSPEPDILVVRESERGRMTELRLEGPADMVIEIVSEGDPRLEEREKLPRYRAAGIEEIWLVDPFERVLRVETRAGGYVPRLAVDERVESVVVKGFWIEARWLWQEPLPSTLRCLRQILG